MNATNGNAKTTNYRTKESRSRERLDSIYSKEINNPKATTSNDGVSGNNKRKDRRTKQVNFQDNRNQKDNNGNIINYKYYESRLVVKKDNNNNFAYDLDGFKEKKEPS